MDWLIKNEWAKTTQDIIWRRSKLGLHLSDKEVERIDVYLRSALTRLEKNQQVANG